MYAYDFSIVPGPDPTVIAQNFGSGILHYGTGPQQPTSYLREIDQAGLERAWIWEHNTDSILGGYDYGVNECKAWEASHPSGLVYLACDLNDGALGGASVEPFCQGWCDTTRESVVGLYGPDHAWAQVRGIVPKLQRMWGVVNWLDGGHADNDPRNIQRWTDLGASIIQLIGSPIDGTDQNLIVKNDWHATSGTVAPRPKEFYEMVLYKTVDDGKETYYRDAGGVLVALEPEEAAVFYGDILAGKVGVESLGGVLGAIAWNVRTKQAFAKLGM